jgi:hypothetical protein
MPRGEIGYRAVPARRCEVSHERLRHFCLDRTHHPSGERDGVFWIAGWLTGPIAKSRNHPYAQAVTVAGWITLFFGLALWPIALIWAYVDIPRRKTGDT